MTANTALSTFAEVWAAEFSKSVSMFTGVTLNLETAPSSAMDGGPVTWHAQAIERDGSGRIWIGASAAALASIAGGSADNDADRLALMAETLDQAARAAIQVLALDGRPGLQCAGPATPDAPGAGVLTQTCTFAADTGASIVCQLAIDGGAQAALSAAPEPAPIAPPVLDIAHEPAVLERFAGVELPVSVVLGRATLRVRDVLKLAVGSLIELNTRTTEPVDICIHDTVVARGEVVSIRGNYGIRILEVMSERERFNLHLKHRRHVITSDAARPHRVH